MIIYKNLYPSDFVDLHNDKGKVYDIFASKTSLIKGKIDRIETEIKECRCKIEDLEKISVKDIYELRSLYIQAFVEKFPHAISFQLNGNSCSFKDCKEDDNFEILRQCTSIHFGHYAPDSYYNRFNTTTTDSSTSFNNIESIVDSKMNYHEREQLITNKENGEVEKLKKQIEELKKEKVDIKYWTLQQIAEKIDITSSLEQVNTDKLIVYLIRNGYIDENYHDYISYFYEGFMTRDDKEFLFSIRNRQSLSFDFKLTKIENLIKKIRLKEFDSKEILNYSLVDFLLENQNEHDNQRKAILNQLCSKNKTSIAFIDGFIDKGLHIESFIALICKQWNTFWDFIILESGYSDEKKDNYLKLIIEHTDIETVKALNGNNHIIRYLSQKKDFISVFPDDPKIQNVLKTLNIKFENLESPESDSKLFDFIYENNLYKINEEMITLFVKSRSKSENILERFKTANYSMIKESGCSQLIEYIDNNLNSYVSNILLVLTENTEESEEYIIELLCKEEAIVSLENRKKIIEKQNCLVNNLSTIEEAEPDLIDWVVEKSKMKATWSNVIFYFESKERAIDDHLIGFLNQECIYNELSKEKLSRENPLTSKVANAVIINENITDDSFEQILKCCPYVYPNLDFESLSDRKIDLLMQNGHFKLSVDRFVYLKEHFAGKHIGLLRRYTGGFIDTISEYSLDKDDILTLLSSPEFNQSQKIVIIQSTNTDLIIGDRDLSNAVCNILAESSFINMDFAVLKSLLLYCHSIENRLRLLLLHLDTLDNEQITDSLTVLGAPYSEIAINGRRPSLSKSILNLNLVKKLKAKDYISSFNEKENKIKINTKLANNN